MSDPIKINPIVKTLEYFSLFLIASTLWQFNLCLAAEELHVKKKAVPETSKTDGFRLSEKAIRTIGLIAKPIESAPEFTIPEKALVHSLDLLAIYRLRGGWYKLVPIEVVRKKGSELVVRSQEIKPGSDRVVTNGIELLRATEMEAFGGGE